jgi:hypothetical protein
MVSKQVGKESFALSVLENLHAHAEKSGVIENAEPAE